ncbi:MAG: serine/threonine-protein phosphatase [Anaerolineaceae bacterium]|nr:serine/threonine-protein phosphatase [Anaerolineaceae bacterium]
MEIQIAAVKINKYFSPESGDFLEFVERPSGGISIVLADGMHSGREAKSVSSMVVRKTISLLAEGVRDGAAARAASDHLYTERNGTESAYLTILSVDLQTDTIVITRNNPVPIFISQRERMECLAGEINPIGLSKNIRPAISEIPLEINTTIIMYTDGLAMAGSRYNQQIDLCTLLESLLEDQAPTSQEIADSILAQAVRLDQGRPSDDMSLIVLRVLSDETDFIRRTTIRLPVFSSTAGL